MSKKTANDLVDGIEGRFWDKVEKTRGGCWLWMGAKNSESYGHLRNGRRWIQAHQAAWLLAGRTIPSGKELDHTCRNPPCVNPSHFELVTSRENTLRGISPPAKNAQKEKCVRGHPFTRANTYLEGTKRKCRECTKRRVQIRQARFSGPRRPKPDRETLAADIERYTFVALGEYYGVSDTAVRKWARAYGL